MSSYYPNPRANQSTESSSSVPSIYGQNPDRQDEEVLPSFNSVDPTDKRIWNECRRESFYYRCIPLSTLFSGLAYIAMKNGTLSKSPKFGYAPKLLIGAALGFYFGKVSYYGKCVEKFENTPNSKIGEYIRRRKIESPHGEHYSAQSSSATGIQSSTTSIDSSPRPRDFSDLDSGTDSYDAVTENLSPYLKFEDTRGSSSMSYDDLRRENREDYARKVAEKHRRQPDRSSSPPPSFSGGAGSQPFEHTQPSSSFEPPVSSPRTFAPRSPTSIKKNKYGDDIWE